MISVVVDTAEELGARAASALLGHPDIDRVGLLGRTPPPSWGDRAAQVSTTEGFDVGIGVDGAAVRVYRRRAPHHPGVGWASAVGVARSLATRLESPSRPAVTIHGTPIRDGDRFVFPPPIGWAVGRSDDSGVFECPVEGSYAGALAAGTGGRTHATADDAVFLAAACLAAGAVIAGRHGDIVAVWERAEDYLEACELFGLVFAVTD